MISVVMKELSSTLAKKYNILDHPTNANVDIILLPCKSCMTQVDWRCKMIGDVYYSSILANSCLR